MDHPFASTPTLPAECAFVVQFDATTLGTQGHVAGRVEHIASAQAARFQSWEELQAFIVRVLTARLSALGTEAVRHPPRE
jgi:hypothetical protein